MTVSIFKSILAVAAGYHRDVFQILERIRSGKSADLISRIRLETDKEKRNLLKQQLPAICFSGTFRQRNDSSLMKHSGLICLDFDGYKSATALSTARGKLKKDLYTFSLFTSPSGDGLKVLVKIPPEPENHKAYFDALREYYDDPHFDISCSNVSRVCYESADTKLFLNPDAQIWMQKQEQEHYSVGTDKPILQLRSESKITENLLKWFTAKFGTAKGSRNTNIFKLAAAFNDFGVSEGEAERVLSQFTEKDFPEREISNIIKSAYTAKDKHGTKYFEDAYTRQKIERRIRSGESIKAIQESTPDYGAEEIEEAVRSIKETLSVTEFWYFDDNGKIKLRPHKYKEYLEQQGYFKLFPDGQDHYVFVKMQENLIDNCAAPHIKDTVLAYLYSNHDFTLSPYDYMANSPKFFKDDYLSLIDTANVEFKEDNTHKAYLYFKNCAVEVTKSGISQIDYLELNGFVWKKHIINREYAPGAAVSEFESFVRLISGDGYDAFRSVIGYLLHSHKTASTNRAIILNDQEISENPNGGSGKGILCAAIGHMKRVVSLDGKHFDFNKSFPYQTVGADTQVLVFDDVKKNFPFENLFSLVTEGITLEKKNKDAIRMPVAKSPKIVITTNYTIGGVGGSFERRKFELELSSYFSVKHTPYDEFGRMLFDDWEEDEWNRFDNYMISCIQYYLEHGLVYPEFKNLEIRKFIKETSYEFYEWAQEAELFNKRLFRRQLFEDFLSEYPDLKKWLPQRKFTAWVERWARYRGAEIETGKYEGNRWTRLKLDSEPMGEEEKDLEVPF